MENRKTRRRKHDDERLGRNRFYRPIQPDRGQPTAAGDLRVGQEQLLLEFRDRVADEFDRHHEQESGCDEEDSTQRQSLHNHIDDHEQSDQNDRGGKQSGDKRGGPAARCLSQRVDKQYGFGPLAKNRDEGEQRDGGACLLGERRVCLAPQKALPGLRVLSQKQPAADIEHQRGGNQDQYPLQDVVVNAIVEQLEQPGGDDARDDGCAGAEIQHRQTMPRSHLAEIGGESRDHEHGLEAFSQKNGSRLNEYAGHDGFALADGFDLPKYAIRHREYQFKILYGVGIIPKKGGAASAAISVCS